jgi:hypothetical protein
LNGKTLAGFASKFEFEVEHENHPLVLRKIAMRRDVAWERSLALGTEFVDCECRITVDGFLLFFDVESDNDKPNFVLNIESVNH